MGNYESQKLELSIERDLNPKEEEHEAFKEEFYKLKDIVWDELRVDPRRRVRG